MEDGRKAVRVRLSGRVQGVSFRVWTRTEAEKLGLSGWVRNEDDGSVTALIVGAEGAVSTMMNRLWEG
ncbi:MAG: acylphosphatase, partial [Mesorhizobium sp.]